MISGKEQDKSMLLIANPAAGRRSIEANLPAVIRVFMDAGYTVTTAITAGNGEACKLAENHAHEHDLIVCAGGDGTLNECVTGLIRSGKSLPVGFIPCGSTNDFASAHGIPTDMLAAAKAAVKGKSRLLDIGRMGERCFLGTAFFGAFSWMGYTTPQERKNRLGFSAYVLDGLKGLNKLKPHGVRLSANGRTHEDEYIFGSVSNTKKLCGIVNLPKLGTELSDGMFEVLLIKRPKNLSDWDEILCGISSGEFESSVFDFFRAGEIGIENEKGLVWSLDGESSGSFDKATINVLSNAIDLKGAGHEGF